MANILNHLLCLPFLAVYHSITFVIRLSANAQKSTSPDNAQPFDLALREDLPDRFFTIDTP